jgi:hypothetical protein
MRLRSESVKRDFLKAGSFQYVLMNNTKPIKHSVLTVNTEESDRGIGHEQTSTHYHCSNHPYCSDDRLKCSSTTSVHTAYV